VAGGKDFSPGFERKTAVLKGEGVRRHEPDPVAERQGDQKRHRQEGHVAGRQGKRVAGPEEHVLRRTRRAAKNVAEERYIIIDILLHSIYN
jgi:hypothetical protein